MSESAYGSVTNDIVLASGGDGNAKARIWERNRKLLYGRNV